MDGIKKGRNGKKHFAFGSRKDKGKLKREDGVFHYEVAQRYI